ncbi:MAG: hypothetical protein MRY32_05935 [Rickettsiales bacterium]|nr:hypothetical protein [Rickettsiales bacterium]
MRLATSLCLLIIILPFFAKADEIPSKLDGVGIMVFDPAYRKRVNLKVYQKKDSKSAVLGRIKIKDEPKDTWSYLVRTWTEKNPDAGWFGKKVIQRYEEKPFNEYKSAKGRVGIIVYEEEPIWLKLDYGWVLRHDLEPNSLRYIGWHEAIDNKIMPEFHIVLDKKIPDQMKLEEARLYAEYSPVGEVAVLNGTDDGATEIVSAQPPLRFALLGERGDWLEVIVVLGQCDTRNGVTDYREGTRGWIKRTTSEGKPQLYREEEACQ